MKLLELYGAYYPFIKGNSAFGCIPETDLKEVLCYINDSSWAAIESRNPDIGDPLVPLCQAMLEFDHLPCVTRYALISCLYSVNEVHRRQRRNKAELDRAEKYYLRLKAESEKLKV